MPNILHKPFGPLLMQTQLSDTVFDLLLSKSKSTRYDLNKDFRNKLAGNIEEEYKLEFNKQDKEIVYNELISLAQEYMSEAKKERRIKKFGRPKSRDIQIVEPIWVNFMKAGEWNPAHFHAGCISCVMYLQVPKEIEDEKYTVRKFKK